MMMTIADVPVLTHHVLIPHRHLLAMITSVRLHGILPGQSIYSTGANIFYADDPLC